LRYNDPLMRELPKKPLPEIDEFAQAIATQKKPHPLLRHKRFAPIAIIGVALLVITLIVAIASRYSYSPGSLIGQPPNNGQPTPTPTPLPEPGLTVLLMGRGGAGHEGGALADTILVARILETQKRVVLISIPRDLWVQIPYDGGNGVAGKINSSYAIGIDSKNYGNKIEKYTGQYGGGTLAKDVIQKVTGLTVDKYVTIDFSGFEKAIDSISGIEVNVERAFTDYEYPIAGRETLDCTTYASGSGTLEVSESDLIATGKLDANALKGLPKEFPCRYEMLHFAAGKQSLDGKTALKYVRSRHSAEDGNDFARSRRQRLVLEAVTDKLFSLGAVTKIPTFFSTLRAHIDTDLSTTDLLGLVPKAQTYREYPVTNLTLSTDNYLGQGYTADRQFALTPLAGEGKFDAIANWIASQTNPSVVLQYPIIEISANWKNSSAAATLKEILNKEGYPAKLGPLVMKNATTSATLLLQSDNFDPQIIQKIKALSQVGEMFVTTALPPATEPTTSDIRILLP
jgi:polyisoprenyl-teichoic acid--peptidoglycan teichoic acid transferase